MLRAEPGKLAPVNSRALFMENPIDRLFIFKLFLLLDCLLKVFAVFRQDFSVCFVVFIAYPHEPLGRNDRHRLCLCFESLKLG